MTAALVAAVVVWGISLPSRRLAAVALDDGSVRGVVHVHSRASDGRGTLDEIGAAAARAGLRFVIVTDHGDGRRIPEDPSYRSGVLVIDAVEISTRSGHYVALGLGRAPYPLAGDAADVVDDVRRLGGFGIAAHPDSPKSELRWSDGAPAVDGIELLNLDTAWRTHAFAGGAGGKASLLRALLAYPVRPTESIAHLVTDAARLRAQWRAQTRQRRVVAMAGADAHAKVALRDAEPGDNALSVAIPSYESSFGATSVHVTPAAPLSGDAEQDARALLAGIRAGHVFLAVDGWASPAALQFTASAGSRTAQAGDVIAPGEPVTLHVRSNAPSGFVTVVWRNADVLETRPEAEFELPVGSSAAVYSVEVRASSAPTAPAWITSNPVYVGQPSPVPSPRVAPNADASARSLFDGQTTEGWSWEADGTSRAVVDVTPFIDATRLRLRYGLSGGADIGQYAAAAVGTSDGVNSADGVRFEVRAEHPMRISVQVRAEVPGAPPERWERSVYVDASEQPRYVRFDEMTPVGKTHAPRPPKVDVRAIMFVVDTTNSEPGVSGRLWLRRVHLLGAQPR